MDSANPLNNLLQQILPGDKANNIYAVFNGNVKDDKFALAKKAFNSLLQMFPYSDQPPHPTTVTVVQAAAANSVVCDKGTVLLQIQNALDGMTQVKTGPDMNASLVHVQTQAATAVGNKTVFIFTDGDVNAKATIDKMITDGIHILCFVLPDNANFDPTPVANTFNASRVAILKTVVEVENFFENVALANIEAPKIASKSSSTSEIFLTIKSTLQFDDYQVYGYGAGANVPILMGTTTTNKIILGDLKPNQKYCLKVRGKKALTNIFSRFSKEEIVHTVAVSEFIKKIRDQVECTKEVSRLRDKLRKHKIPPSLAKTGFKCFNIVLFSEMGNGKSSFINTIQTALQDDDVDPCQSAKAGISSESFTRKLSKFTIYGVTPVKVWDTPGKQVNKEYDELAALTKGKLREGFEEGSKQDETNIFFNTKSDINSTPHAYLILIDIWGVHNPDQVRECKELNIAFKKDVGVPTLAAVTKFDMWKGDESEPLLTGNLHKICEHSQISDIIQQFANDAGISSKDVFPILNYLGANEERSPVKDLLALQLLNKTITSIETHFKSYKVLNIVDQSDKSVTALLIDRLDMRLADFERDYFRRLTTDKFKPIGLYNGDELVSEKDYELTTLEEIALDPNYAEDGYVNYTVKVENKLCESSSANSRKGRIIRISYHPSLSKQEQEVRCEKETLKWLRQELELPGKFGFSKRSIAELGMFEEKDEANTLIVDVADSQNKLYVVQQQTPAPPEPIRTNIKCQNCDFKLSTFFKEKVLSEIRKEIDSKDLRNKHQHQSYVFLTNDGYEIAESDEINMKFDDIVFKDDLNKDQISVKCL